MTLSEFLRWPRTRAVPHMRKRMLTCVLPGVLAALLLPVHTLSAQIRGTSPTSLPPRQYSGPPRWWFSGGVSGVGLGSVNDGDSQSRWDFGNDPLWQMRGSLERALTSGPTIGVTVGYGVVDVTLTPLAEVDLPERPDMPCLNGCDAQVELWTAMGLFRSGGGNGFHGVFEAQGGVTGFRNLRTRGDSTQDGGQAIGSKTQQFDISGALGFGVGYTLSSGFQVALVQDVGMGWHAKSGLPNSLERTWRIRNTRASLRFAF